MTNRLEGDIRTFWSSRADSWFAHNALEKDFILNVKSHLAPYISNLGLNEKVLDIAAGANNAVYYPEMFDMSRVTALDITPEMLALNPSGKKVLADANKGLKFTDNSFDAVVSVFGMRYFNNQAYVLFESIRVVRPGDWAVFVDFDMASIPAEVHEFNADRLANIAQSHGLNVAHTVMYEPNDNRRHARLDLLAVQKPRGVHDFSL